MVHLKIIGIFALVFVGGCIAHLLGHEFNAGAVIAAACLWVYLILYNVMN
jgi:hypothetical protein